MELLYIYVEDFRNFKNEGFNFSTEYLFTTSIEDGETTISISKNKDAFENFFNDKRISSVTAIIGQNGTGKSNILEFIRDQLSFGEGIKSRCVIAVKDHNEQNHPLGIYLANGLNVNIQDTDNLFRQYEINHLSDHYPDISSFSDCSIIYYSNIFDLRYTSQLHIPLEEEPQFTSETRFNNISTHETLDKDHENFAYEFKTTVDKTDAYKVRELSRNIQFITTDNRALLDFRLPEELVIRIIDDDRSSIKRFESVTPGLFDFLDNQQNEFSLSNESGQIFINRLCRAILFNYFKQNLDFPRFNPEGEYLKSIAGRSFMEFFFNFFRDILNGNEDNKAYSFIRSSVELVDILYEYLVRRNSAFRPIENGGALALNVTFEGKDSIIKFLNLYTTSRLVSDYLTFYWRGLSSGEQSMLTLLSRFYSLSDTQTPPSLKVKGSLIILIDEGDVYFHPEWQRKYLSLLISFLPQNFGARQIQLILTSNTPYLASDLPKSNILFLRKKKSAEDDDIAQDQIALNPNNDRKETFASNIHTLLSNSFYLENGLIGSFAELKINEVIDFIKKKRRNMSKLKSMKQTIEIIGEPIIKDRLKELWIREFGIDEEIEALENRIRDLKGRKARKPGK